MKKSVVAYIFLLMGVLVVVGYLGYAAVMFTPDEDKEICTELRVSISSKVKLITMREITDILNAGDLHPVGVSLQNLRTESIEKLLLKHPVIRAVECYHIPNTNQVQLEIELREPKLIVSGRENYYVDTERNIMPMSPYTTAYLPIVTGLVTHTMAKTKMYDFVDYIEKNPFWNAQIEQIHIRSDMKIELVPRLGNAIILLGKLENYEVKLNRLFRLYQRGFNVLGWNKYKMLDLEYDGQIVATIDEELLSKSKIIKKIK